MNEQKTKVAEASAGRAMKLYDDGEFLQALDEIQAAIGICPDNSSWHFNKALTLDSLERFDEAISEYETALQLNPNDLEIMNSLAINYIRTGGHDRAIDTFEKIQKLDPKFEPCYCNRIIVYAEMGKYDLADQMFSLAQQIKPDCPLCFYNIGNTLFARGKHREAVKCWLRTAELEPSHPQINYRIAQACWSEGDKGQARKHFLEELHENPGGTEVILDFGLFLLLAGDIDLAREKFIHLLELRPCFAPALFYLGEIAFKRGNYNQAELLFNQALQKDNTLPGPGYRLTQYALRRGQKLKARAYLVSELELSPEYADVMVSMGSMFLAIGNLLDHAVHCLLRAVDIDCANADAYYYLGLTSAVKGEFQDAAEFFTHSLDLRPGDARTLEASALAYSAMGRLSDARERINGVSKLGIKNPQLKALGRRIWLARLTACLPLVYSKWIRGFLLKGKKYRIMLERLTGSYQDLDWYPNTNSCVMSKGRKLKPSQMPPFMVRKAEWRTQASQESKR